MFNFIYDKIYICPSLYNYFLSVLLSLPSFTSQHSLNICSIFCLSISPSLSGIVCLNDSVYFFLIFVVSSLSVFYHLSLIFILLFSRFQFSLIFLLYFLLFFPALTFFVFHCLCIIPTFVYAPLLFFISTSLTNC